MIFLESILLLFSFVLLVFTMFYKVTNKTNYFIIVFLYTIVFIVYIVFGYSRWQFYPLYLMLFVLFFVVLLEQYRHYVFNKIMRRLVMAVLSIFLLFTVFSVFAFPVYEIPNPTGDYLIGTQQFIIDDTTRSEAYGDPEYRRFKIQIWYPADTVDGFEQAPWLEGGKVLSRAFANDNYIPGFALDHTVDVLSNSFSNAPISNTLEKYPIVVVSHGWRAFSTIHTDLIEELASHGYIVVAIDHTYGSVATVFAEDDVAYLNLDALPLREGNPDFLDDAKQLVNTYAGDIEETLHYLELLNQDSDSDFFEKLDVETIGHLGHSTGGGAGVQTALIDTRIDAVLGMDAWVEPIGLTDVSNGLNIPSLFLRSGSWETGENNEYLYTLMEESNIASNLYQIKGTTHYDFAMVYMYSPLTKFIGFTGSVDKDELVVLLKSTVLDFFDQTLKGAASSVDLDEIDEYSKVDILE